MAPGLYIGGGFPPGDPRRVPIGRDASAAPYRLLDAIRGREPRPPPPPIASAPGTMMAHFTQALWDSNADAVGQLLGSIPALAHAPLWHRGPAFSCWFTGVDPRPSTTDAIREHVLVFAVKIPLYSHGPYGDLSRWPRALAVVRRLVEAGVGLPSRRLAGLLCHVCIRYDSPELLRLLLRAGAHLRRSEVWGARGIGTLAAERGAFLLVDVLFELGVRYTPFANGLPHGTLEGVREAVVQAAQNGFSTVIEVFLSRIDDKLLRQQLSAAHDCDLTVLDAILIAATDRLELTDADEVPLQHPHAWRPMSWRRRRERMVHCLLDRGASAVAADSAGRTAIQCACRWAGPELVRRLIAWVPGGLDCQLPYIDWLDRDAHAVESIRAGEGVTYLHVAAGYHNAAAVACLIEAGAQALCDDYGRTPLHWCLLSRALPSLDEAEALLNRPMAGRDKAFTTWSPTIGVIAALCQLESLDVNKEDYWGRTALHLAASNSQWEAMAFLVSLGADMGIRDENGHTAFHVMAANVRDPSRGADLPRAVSLGLEMLWATLLTATEVEADDLGVDVADADGQTALHQACEKGNVLMVDILLSLGAYVDCRDSSGWTPLCCAAGSQCQDRGEAQELVSPDEADRRQMRALRMRGVLLNAGADTTAVTVAGMTAIDIEIQMNAKLAASVTRYADSKRSSRAM